MKISSNKRFFFSWEFMERIIEFAVIKKSLHI
jgi:hypothetical protein